MVSLSGKTHISMQNANVYNRKFDNCLKRAEEKGEKKDDTRDRETYS